MNASLTAAATTTAVTAAEEAPLPVDEGEDRREDDRVPADPPSHPLAAAVGPALAADRTPRVPRRQDQPGLLDAAEWDAGEPRR